MPIEPDDTGRIASLHLLLTWEGRLNNSRLRDLFGVAVTRASVLIRQFRDTYPHCLELDTKSRSYIATQHFYHLHGPKSPAARDASLDRYISLVGIAPAADPSQPEHPLCAAFPTFSSPDPTVFGVLQRAIQTKVVIKIAYASMHHPEAHSRLIHPHTLVRTERRWHVRAYCSATESYRDYSLGRMSKVSLTEEPSLHRASDDVAWQTKVPVQLIGHPLLSLAQQMVIRREYFGGTAAMTHTCRAALVHYLIKSLHAAVDTQLQTPPDYQLAISNIEDLQPWLFQG